MHIDDLPQPIFITRQHALSRLVDELSQETAIAVDTEANGLYAYREQVCLIQFSTSENDYLVDTLALDDLSPLGAIFANPEIEKIFHAAEYDLIILHQDYDFSIHNLFDTMLAARILGWEHVGLGSILKKQFGIHVDKKYQRANWGQRPLTSEMLRYAQVDTHFLLQLRQKLTGDLQARGRWELAQEDFLRYSKTDSLNHRNGKPDVWRIRGAHDLDSKKAAVLNELCRYRDKKARALNRPLFKVISDKALLSIAEAAPRSRGQLTHINNISDRQISWLGEGIIASVLRGLKADPITPPHKPRPSNDYLERVDRLRRWRIRKAKQWGVNSDVILPKDILYDLAEKNPTSKAAFDMILNSIPWRRQEFGEEIFNLLAAIQL
ncbi:MAG: ribonuclease D [Chloroflexi bacterium]|jgi:ribonuclease D|nr:ribonuclease D [Chloroflexota bacterium]